MARPKSLVQEILLSASIILLAFPFTPLFLLFILLVVFPAKLWTRVVSYLAHLIDPDIGQILTGLPAGQIRDFDTIHTKPCTTEVAQLLFNGPFDFELIVNRFNKEAIIRIESEKAYPTLQYPELQQYFVKFLGYVFLKWDRKFNISNHFTHFNPNSDKPVTRPELIKLWESLMSKPFPKERSPWEFVVVDNYQPDPSELEMWKKVKKMKPQTDKNHYYCVFLRMHHALGDGFVISKMLSFLSEDDFTPNFPTKITKLKRFLMTLRALTLGPYDTLNWLMRCSEDYHCLHIPGSEQSHEVYIAETDLIPVNRVKLIKDKFGVPFTVVLVAAISGGFRKYFVNYRKPVPKVMSAAVPFATSDHSDRIQNEFSLATLSYGVHSDDPKERINYAHNSMKFLMNTSWMIMMNVIADSFGSLPLSLFKKCSERQPYGSTYSTLPGPKKCLKALNGSLLEVNFSNGSNIDNPSFGLSSLTVDDHFRIVFFVDTNVIKSRKEAEDIIQYIWEEFDVLEHYQERRNSFDLFPEAVHNIKYD